MAVIIALLGGYAFKSTTGATEVVKDTYDRPLMAINFARSAGQVFADVEINILTELHKVGPDEMASLKSAKKLLAVFKEDLQIAKDRSISDKAVTYFADIDSTLVEWEDLVFNPDTDFDQENVLKLENLASTIAANLEIVVELQTNASFRTREAALTQMEKVKKYTFMAILGALLLTFLLSAWISFTIIRPLNIAAEQNLKTLAQDRLADSIENSADSILLTDSTGVIIVANPQVKIMFPEFKNLDLLQSNFADLFEQSACPKTIDYKIDLLAQQISCADGRSIRVSVSQTKEGGRLYIWTDNTQEFEKAERLREARDAAEAANATKSKFLATMSHELRTPLNAIIGFSNVLEDEHKAANGNPQHAEMAAIIMQSGMDLLEILTNVLYVSQGFEENVAEVNFDRFNFVKLVESTLAKKTHSLKEKHIRVMWNDKDVPVFFRANERHMETLVTSLISNAIKFNREGGVIKIDIKAGNNEHLEFDIIDTGIGISENNMTHIFEPFAQVESGHTRSYDGVGLGLTLAKQIVDHYQGHMNIQSRMGRGTVVSVSLPHRIPSSRVSIDANQYSPTVRKVA